MGQEAWPLPSGRQDHQRQVRGREAPGHLAAAYRCLKLSEWPGTPLDDDLRKGSLCPCAFPSARWLQVEVEPSAWELCFPCYGVSVLKRSAHMGRGGGKTRGWGRRPCGWVGTAPSLLSESDSDPLLAPACSGSASCSFGSCRLGWLFNFSPRTEAREEGCWCLCSPPAPFSEHQGGRGESVG